MTRTIPVDIDGLNLLLGGGIPVLKRHEDFGESATLLVRGPPGSGKGKGARDRSLASAGTTAMCAIGSVGLSAEERRR